ncbi:MAG: four helix bundle protein [Candidatus Jacksonbacteria bacterium]
MIAQNSKFKTQHASSAVRRKGGNHNSKLKTEVKYRAYQFSLDIIKFAASFPNTRVYWIVSDQVLRSAMSIGANIVEAKSSSSKRDFIKYYEIALKSANETKYWLCLLRDGKLTEKEETNRLLQEVIEISNMLGSSLLTLKNKR